jgi:hypothetical protein
MTRYEEYLEKTVADRTYNGVTIPIKKSLSNEVPEIVKRFNNYEVSEEELERHFNTFKVVQK